MSIVAEPYKEIKGLFPQGKIILHDGRMLDCYPLAAQAPDKIDEDHLELDTTGQFLSVGAKKPQPVSPKSKDTEEQKQLFIKNAFYLLAHKERIMSDSRMFLCRIPIQSGLAYTGNSGFRNPTLGIYLEWWSIVEGAMRTDRKGRKSLVYHLAGSPLSGANKCAAVREDGKIEIVSLSPFNAHWGPFTRLNNRYTEAKQLYQAYTLQEVLNILNQEDDGNTGYAHSIEMQYMTHEYVKTHNISKVLVTELSRLGRDTLQVLQVIELLNKEGISLYIQNYNIETLTEEGKINPCPRFSMKYDYRRNRVLDDKEYNRKIYEKMLAKNPALNELVVGLGLMPENE